MKRTASKILSYGSSGRVYGTGKVEAVGTPLDDEIWNLYTQYVKYGTD